MGKWWNYVRTFGKTFCFGDYKYRRIPVQFNERTVRPRIQATEGPFRMKITPKFFFRISQILDTPVGPLFITPVSPSSKLHSMETRLSQSGGRCHATELVHGISVCLPTVFPDRSSTSKRCHWIKQKKCFW